MALKIIKTKLLYIIICADNESRTHIENLKDFHPEPLEDIGKIEQRKNSRPIFSSYSLGHFPFY
jgi:hypothetical protein